APWRRVKELSRSQGAPRWACRPTEATRSRSQGPPRSPHRPTEATRSTRRSRDAQVHRVWETQEGEPAMAHRNDPNRGTPHTGTGPREPRHYAAPRDPALYDGMPSVTHRRWGEDRSTEADSYGRHLQGDGDVTQGGSGESQGPG